MNEVRLELECKGSSNCVSTFYSCASQAGTTIRTGCILSQSILEACEKCDGFLQSSNPAHAICCGVEQHPPGGKMVMKLERWLSG